MMFNCQENSKDYRAYPIPFLYLFLVCIFSHFELLLKKVDARPDTVSCFSVNNNLHDESIIDNKKLLVDDNNNESQKKTKARRIRPRIPVLQYHDDWVCVSKPAGMTVHRSTNTPRSQLVLSTLLKRQLSRKVYPVHRLDHRTSGAILFAFDSNTCSNLHKALTFGESKVINGNKVNASKKEYLALLRGDWKRKFGDVEEIVIDKPLDVKGISKEAKTTFRLLASSSGTESCNNSDNESESFMNGYQYAPSACSLVVCQPQTGRTHQIRRHAFAMGCPVIGDSQHGDSKVNRWWRENRNMNRLFLHCLSLDLPPLGIMQMLDRDFSKSQNDNDFEDLEEEIITNNIPSSTRIEDKTKEQKDYSLDRVQCTAPIPEELSLTLGHDNMTSLWNEAREKDPRLELEPFDTRGGTFGRHFRKSLAAR